jgi:hypothetical protein
MAAKQVAAEDIIIQSRSWDTGCPVSVPAVSWDRWPSFRLPVGWNFGISLEGVVLHFVDVLKPFLSVCVRCFSKESILSASKMSSPQVVVTIPPEKLVACFSLIVSLSKFRYRIHPNSQMWTIYVLKFLQQSSIHTVTHPSTCIHPVVSSNCLPPCRSIMIA